MVKKIDTGGKNYGQNNPQNFVHNHDQYQIQDVHAVLNIGPNLHQGVNENMQNKLPNDQNYVTREEFVEFNESINPLTSPGEGVTVFTSPYLSAGAPAKGEAKGLMND